jgi:hypothetical protein
MVMVIGVRGLLMFAWSSMKSTRKEAKYMKKNRIIWHMAQVDPIKIFFKHPYI